MINGMTGFGSTQIKAGKVRGFLEIKSLNHRYFDVVYYLPMGFASIENKLRQMIHKQIKRGRVTVSLKITDKPAPHLVFNSDVVNKYLRYGKSMKKEFALDNNLTLADLLRLPGVVEAHDAFVGPQEVWPAVEKAVSQALKSVVKMRTREGRSLAADIKSVLSRMLMQLSKIKSRLKVLQREQKKKLTPDEFLAYQKSNDINEEVARLTHYIEEFKILLKATVSVGKKMDFVAQEMQRETNTIGSKVQDKIVSNAVISIKSKIEKLREQAQNIE